jgi:DNA segregation ATPase FtsK/SpoIIIE and related proteins
MGILRRQYERQMKEQEKEKGNDDDNKGGGHRGGPSLLLVIGIVVMITLFFPLLQRQSPVFQPLASSVDLSGRATQLAQQQASLQNSMTHAAGVSTEQAFAAQLEVQRQQNALSTQIAQATATESAHATSTSWSLTQTPMAAEQILRDLELDKKQREAYWSQYVSPLKVFGLALLAFVSLVLLVVGAAWAAYLIIPAIAARMRFVKEDRGERTIHAGQHSITRVDLMHEPTLTERRDGTMVASGGAVDPLLQSQVAHDAARVKALQGYASASRPAKESLPRALPISTSAMTEPEPETVERLFPLPSWNIMESWDGKHGLPYGVSASGLELMDIHLHPHIGVLGKTGSGKSRRFLRPFLAGALAAGHRVVIIGKQTDFTPFMDHPNATLIPIRELTMDTEAERYAGLLRLVVEEMNRRDEFLTANRKSTWAMAGLENTILVLDEVGNSIDLMPRNYAELSLRYLMGLTKEGRKVGFNVIFTSQRAKSLRDPITQVSRAVFFVEDKQESRYALDALGAESLQPGYFYSRFGSIKLTGAFDPTDEQIERFLKQRPVKRLEKQDWIDLEARDIDRIEKPKAAGDLPPKTEIEVLAESIRAEWHAGMTKSEVSRLLGRPFGGASWTSKVNQVIEYLSSSSSTNNMPESGTLAPAR